MRWRNVKTGALVEGPDWLCMPQGIYEPVDGPSAGFPCDQEEPAESFDEEAPLDGESPLDDEQDDSDGEISSANW